MAARRLRVRPPTLVKFPPTNRRLPSAESAIVRTLLLPVLCWAFGSQAVTVPVFASMAARLFRVKVPFLSVTWVKEPAR
jgi:hypothetical protein